MDARSAAPVEPILVPPVCTRAITKARNKGIYRSRPLWVNQDRHLFGSASDEGDLSFQQEVDKDQMATWVSWLAPWQVILHGTWRWEASVWSAQRAVEKFRLKHLSRCSFFYALEENPGRDGYHVHGLLADCTAIYWKDIWAAWCKRYGRFRSEPVRSTEDVTRYCAKYVTKERAWWDVFLQWHRKQAIRDPNFQLRGGHFGEELNFSVTS